MLVRDRGKQRFSLPGGGANRDEPALAAAVRELHEELGMVATKAERRPECDFRGSFSMHEVVVIHTGDDPIIMGGELEDFCWWDMEQEMPCYEHVKRVMAKLKAW